MLKKIWSFIKRLFGGKKPSDNPSSPSFTVEFAYGGVNFNKAKEDPSAVIGSLVVNNDSMKYSWVKGNLRGWGLADTVPEALAIFAVKDSSGKWKGGKFEWISKSRTTRAFTNIKGGYSGWPRDAVQKAKGYAFCICSKDAKKRTNWITCDKRVAEARIHASATPMDKMDPPEVEVEQPKKRGRPRKNKED